MRRTVAGLGVAAVLILGQAAMAGPAAAARRCTYDVNTLTDVCNGGTSETAHGGGGAGGHSVQSPGDYTWSGGAGGPGGGAYGEHCTGNHITYEQWCVGSNNHP